MARIRSVHPELFTDEQFCSLSPHARLLSIGIWTQCDDHGIFEWKPFNMKIVLAPVDNVDIAALLQDLIRAGRIKPFDVDGKAYGAVRNFCRYQRPKKPAYKYPFPSELRTYVAWSGDNSPPVTHSAPTEGEKPPHRRGEERRGRVEDNSKTSTESLERVAPASIEAPPPSAPETLSQVPPSAPKERKPIGISLGTPLPGDWTPNAELCAKVQLDFGMMIDDINAELPAFHALNVQGGVLSQDWSATFYLFAKRWKEHRAKQAPPRLELSKGGPAKRPEDFDNVDWNRVVAFYARTGRWERGAGPDPHSPACLCPKDILLVAGVNPETGERQIPPRKASA